MNFKLFGKTILEGNIKFGLFVGHPLSQQAMEPDVPGGPARKKPSSPLKGTPCQLSMFIGGRLGFHFHAPRVFFFMYSFGKVPQKVTKLYFQVLWATQQKRVVF